MERTVTPLTELSFESPLGLTNLLGLEYVNSIVYYDGPLLAHYRDSNSVDYFYHWLDGDDKFNRWVIYAVEPELVGKVKTDPETPYGPMLSTHDGFLIVDINDNGKTCRVYLYSKETFPDEYK
jgi:hypothetical protein